MFSMDMKKTGPLFDGAMKAAIASAVLDAAVVVGKAGVNTIVSRLGQKLQNPTGFYQSQIQSNRAAKSVILSDGGVVYGPWLEGTRSRNAASRFKGYKIFRQTKRELQGKAPLLSQPKVYGAVRKVQGGAG